MSQAKKAIYALVDPLTGADRYVGCARDDPEKRLRDHVAEALHVLRKKGPDALTDKHVWICELMRLDKTPTVRVLEWAERSLAPAREAFWIRQLRKDGAEILNVQAVSTELPQPHKPSNSVKRAEHQWASRGRARATRQPTARKPSAAPVMNQGAAALATILDDLGVAKSTAEDAIDMSRGYLTAAMQGRSVPKYKTRMRIEAIYGVPAGAWDLPVGAPSEVSP